MLGVAGRHFECGGTSGAGSRAEKVGFGAEETGLGALMAAPEAAAAAEGENGAGDEDEEALKRLEDLVTEFHRFRDNLPKKPCDPDGDPGGDPSGDPADPEALARQMEATLRLMDHVTVSPCSRARALLLRAQVLGGTPEGSPRAEEALARAVKLDPGLLRAWTRLGELKWSRGDLRGARDCFRGALNHGEDAEARRLLSMVLRAGGGGENGAKSGGNGANALWESRAQAEAAVRCDPKDGKSWYVLGNAYVSLFFAGGQNPQDAQRALGAYAQAERVDPKAANNPDLHLNRATLLQYQERFGEALEGLSRAGELAPGWAEPRRRHAHLLDFLERLRAALANRARPRAGRSRRRGQEVGGASEGLRPLRPGANPGQTLSGRVLFALSPPERVPLALGVAVGGGATVVVTVYNAAPEWGVAVGEGLGVPNPHLTLHQHQHQGQVFSFPGVRVSSPLSLLVNGKRPPPRALAPPRLALSAPPPLPDTPPGPQ